MVLDIAVERETEGDLLLGDMGYGMPFKPGTFDGVIRCVCTSHSAGIMWNILTSVRVWDVIMYKEKCHRKTVNSEINNGVQQMWFHKLSSKHCHSNHTSECRSQNVALALKRQSFITITHVYNILVIKKTFRCLHL